MEYVVKLLNKRLQHKQSWNGDYLAGIQATQVHMHFKVAAQIPAAQVQKIKIIFQGTKHQSYSILLIG